MSSGEILNFQDDGGRAIVDCQGAEITAMLELHPGDIAIFFDKRFPPDPTDDPESAPVNRVAVIIDESGALFVGRRFGFKRIEHIAMAELIEATNVTFRRAPLSEYSSQIAVYFDRYRNSLSYFEAGLSALHIQNMQPFVECRLFPARPSYANDEQYHEQWREMKASLQPFDIVFTVDCSSLVSRLIAWSTHGVWSHVALHVGDGQISESTTSGLRVVPIEAYKKRNYRVAVYRLIELQRSPRTKEDAVEAVHRANQRFHPTRYNYQAAILHGLRSFFGDHAQNLVPNSQIYQGGLIRIAHV